MPTKEKFLQETIFCHREILKCMGTWNQLHPESPLWFKFSLSHLFCSKCILVIRSSCGDQRGQRPSESLIPLQRQTENYVAAKITINSSHVKSPLEYDLHSHGYDALVYRTAWLNNHIIRGRGHMKYYEHRIRMQQKCYCWYFSQADLRVRQSLHLARWHPEVISPCDTVTQWYSRTDYAFSALSFYEI